MLNTGRNHYLVICWTVGPSISPSLFKTNGSHCCRPIGCGRLLGLARHQSLPLFPPEGASNVIASARRVVSQDFGMGICELQ